MGGGDPFSSFFGGDFGGIVTKETSIFTYVYSSILIKSKLLELFW